MNVDQGSRIITGKRGRTRRAWTALAVSVATAVAGMGFAPAASAVNAEQSQVVSDNPANFTPHVEDGAVVAITQIGGTMFAAGSFTTVRNEGTNSTMSRPYIFAFNATTGAIITSFAPSFNGDINSLDTDGTYLYAGGGFTSVNGQTRRKVAKLTTSGALAPGQPPAVNSYVNEVVVRGDRLYIGGLFTKVGGQDRAALAALNKDTGDLLSEVDVSFTGQYNGGTTNIKRFDVTADGRTLAAVGNFTTVGGLPHEQVVKVDLPATGPAVVNGWGTTRYSQAQNNCAGVFDTVTRDVDFSPGGDYFVVTTTGAFAGGANSGTLCDTNARWETAASTSGQQPTWVNYTGGDTSYGVAVTGTAVYVGGHMRWANNPFQGDNAGPGAVPREGIQALDPVNGLPLSWNPGRTRGVGAQALFATSQGLWVGSDTDRFAGELRSRVAFLPLAGGTTVPQISPATLPNSLYAVQRSTDNGRTLYRVNAGGDAVLSQDGGPDWSTDTSGSPSPLHNAGSNTSNSTIGSLDSTVPAGTPSNLYTTERWDPNGGNEMQWSFPVAPGRDVQVRLYLANTCDCTKLAGQRKFDVSIEGANVLDDIDLSSSVGHKVGTMRSFDITSDGSVDIAWGHVVENPLVNAIEIIDPSITPTGEAPLTRRPVDGSGAPTGPSTVVDSSSVWTAARGTFLVGGTLYYGTSTGLFARSFNQGSLGSVREVNLYDDPDNGQRIPFPTGNITGSFYDTGLHRIYYTLAGDTRLFYRYFTPESEVVGAQTFTAGAGGLDFSRTAGMTFADGAIFFGSTTDGNLRTASFADGRVTGGSSVVSADGTWRSRGLFVAGPKSAAANQSPTASFTQSCTDLSCAFDGGGSSDPDGTIASYAWNFGDNSAAGSGATPTHPYTAAGTYTVTLTVTDDRGATAQATAQVTVTAPPSPAGDITFAAADSSSSNATSARLTLPAGIQPGDQLLLFLTTNRSTTATNPTAGGAWTLLQTGSGDRAQIQTWIWARTAVAGDAGRTVPVALSNRSKYVMSVAAYRGATLDTSALAAETVNRSAHTTPTLTATTTGSWLVSYWADKTSATTDWASPTGVTDRTEEIGAGSGRVTSLLADTGPVPTGTVGGLTATATSSSLKALTASIILRPTP